MSRIIKYLVRTFEDSDDRVDLLNEAEYRALRRLKFLTILVSAALGAIMVPLLIFPVMHYESFFQILNFSFHVAGLEICLSTLEILYGICLVMVEVYLLYLLHLFASHQMAVICGFDKYRSENKESINEKWKQIISDNRNNVIKVFGFNPYLEINKKVLMFFNLLLVLKAAISNWILKFLLRRFVGRYIIRQWIELVGMPVYALWNGLATYRLLNRMQLAYMGEMAIERKLDQWLLYLSKNEDAKEMFFQSIQQVLMINRKHEVNINHLLMHIQIKLGMHDLTPVTTIEFITNFDELSDLNKDFVAEVIIFCLVLSENFENVRWSKTWKKLKVSGAIRMKYKELKLARLKFLKGQGIGL